MGQAVQVFNWCHGVYFGSKAEARISTEVTGGACRVMDPDLLHPPPLYYIYTILIYLLPLLFPRTGHDYFLTPQNQHYFSPETQNIVAFVFHCNNITHL